MEFYKLSPHTQVQTTDSIEKYKEKVSVLISAKFLQLSLTIPILTQYLSVTAPDRRPRTVSQRRAVKKKP